MREQGKKAASGAIDKETEEVLIHVIRKHPRFTDVFDAHIPDADLEVSRRLVLASCRSILGSRRAGRVASA